MQGRVLANRYRLESKLGHGGMGSVWRAHDDNLGIDVAVKLIDPTFVDSPEATARFRREAVAGAGLRCSHIVHVTDYGVDGDTPFIAMDLLEGESLAARLEREGKLSFDVAVQLLAQVADALVFAHDKRIVHRDLKPDNVFIVREGTKEVVKVLDFGVAKRLDAQSFGNLKTNTGALLGTPYYMSPEQTRGSPNLDQRTDLWSYGVIAYECVTGRRPFDADTLPDLLMAICRDPVPPPSQVAAVPTGFDEWFAKATARDAEQRFRNAAEASTALCALCGNRISDPAPRPSGTSSPVVAAHTARVEEPELAKSVGPSSVTSPGTQGAQSKRRVVIWATSAVLAVAVAGYWAVTASRSEARQSAPSTATVDVAPIAGSSVTPAASLATNAVMVIPVPPAAASPSVVVVVPAAGSTDTNSVSSKPLVTPKPSTPTTHRPPTPQRRFGGGF
jgi:eukaryotic-like serine/threonine-protein kinase